MNVLHSVSRESRMTLVYSPGIIFLAAHSFPSFFLFKLLKRFILVIDFQNIANILLINTTRYQKKRVHRQFLPFTYSILLFSEIAQHKVPHKYYSNKKVCIIEMVCIIICILYNVTFLYVYCMSETWPGNT